MLLSIITINYNNLQGLQRTFNSVFSQSYRDFEYIVIDGGSTDGSKELIEANADKIAYWLSEKDHGIYNAMNKGLKAAAGEYVLFLNSGDTLFDETSVNKIFNHLHTFDIIYGDIKVTGPDVHDHASDYDEKLSFSFLADFGLPHPATYIKRSLLAQLGGYDQHLKICSDWKFIMLAICRHNATYRKYNDVLAVFYRDGLSSKPENLVVINKEKQDFLKKEFPVFTNDHDIIRKLTIELADARSKYDELKAEMHRSFLLRTLIKAGLLQKFK